MLLKNSLLLLLAGLLLSACDKEEEARVHPDLAPYLRTFEEEATQRGLSISFAKSPIHAIFVSEADRIELGWCGAAVNGIESININVVFWPGIPAMQKERLIFHELGHCVLNRSHLETISENGRCLSIMNSGLNCSDNYSAETREKYLDELFLR